ncbi:MAG: CRISPR-associated endonuclease Cas2 [Phycisphaerales bacterium]|nr:CRISPR-associated endonuclease Cas2 [Phycisphaerales bacterium]
MRRCYLVCYDVRHDKRLRRIHKLMKAYGEPWQYGEPPDRGSSGQADDTPADDEDD